MTETSNAPKGSWQLSLMVLMASMLLMCTAMMLESCTEQTKPDGAKQEATKTEPAIDDNGKEATTPADTASEQTPDPGTKEETTTPEPKGNEPDAPGKDTGQPEPTDKEMLADAAADAGPTTPCTGVQPPYPDAGEGGPPPEIDVPETIPPDSGCKYKPGQCIGADAPPWKLEDFQPQSCGYKKSYNLTAFRGYVTVVALLSAW